MLMSKLMEATIGFDKMVDVTLPLLKEYIEVHGALCKMENEVEELKIKCKRLEVEKKYDWTKEKRLSNRIVLFMGET